MSIWHLALWSFINMPLVIICSQHFFEAPQVRETRCLAPSRIEAPRHRCSWRPPRRLWTTETPQPRRGRCPPHGAAAFGLRCKIHIQTFKASFLQHYILLKWCVKMRRPVRTKSSQLVDNMVWNQVSNHGLKSEVDAPWEDDGSCRHAELEQWMFWTPHLQNCSRQEKHSQTHWKSTSNKFQGFSRHLFCNINITCDETICDGFSNEEAIKDNVISHVVNENAHAFCTLTCFIAITVPDMFRIFRSGKTQLCQTFAENTDMFLRLPAQNFIMKCPKWDTQYIHKQFAKHTQQVSIPSCFRQITFNKTMSINKDIYKVDVIHQHATCDHWFDPTIFLKPPKSARLDVWRLLPGLRPGPSLSVASTATPLDSKKLCSVDVAVVRRFVQRRLASGAFSRKPVWPFWLPGQRQRRGRLRRGDDESGGNAELYTRSTDKRTMNVLDSTSSKLLTFTKTLDKLQYIFMFDEKNAILTAFSMIMRPVRTMSSIRW